MIAMAISVGAVSEREKTLAQRTDNVSLAKSCRPPPSYVMTTGAKRSGGILAPSCLEPTAEDPSIPLTLQSG